MSIDTLEREEQLDRIVADYLRAVRDGNAPSREELLGRYPEFAAELGSFLADHAELNRMAQPIRQAIATPVGFPLPHEFGPYRLEAELGRGGMGVVYRAVERRVGRLVAVKVLQQGPLATEEDRLRLRIEAEAIARLGHHPNIVPLLDVGTEQGHPYLTMQLILGPNLAAIKHRYRSQPREAAALVAVLAETLSDAHQRGIAHRDLKPSNILLAVPVGESLDAVGAAVLPLHEYRPVVTDFGLARLLAGGREGPTLTGAVLGTPAYMAPEQARGEETTLAVDVYGLGAILYDLLAGRPPHQGAPLEVLRKVSDEEPVPPRELNPDVPRDLETICLKCLRKNPQERYGSARELADDLGRFLRGEPVQARPVGRLGRLWRWTCREPLTAALLLAVFLLLVGGTTATTLLWLRAEANYLRAEREVAQAERSFGLAHEVVRDFCVRFAEEAEQAGGLQPATRALLERARGYYAVFLERHATDPALRQELADVHDLLGKVHLALGDRDAARESLREARRLVARFHAEHPDDVRWRRRLVGLTANLGTLEADTDDARLHFEEALTLTERFLQTHPDDVDLRSGRAHTLANLGAAWEKRGDRAEARRCYEAACQLLRHLRRDDPERASLQSDLAFALFNLGALRSHERGGLPDALAALNETWQIRERLYRDRPGDPRRQADLAAALHAYAVFLREDRQPDKAREAFERALRLRQGLVERSPGVVRYHADLAATLKQIGFSLLDQGDPAGPLPYYRQAAERLQKVVAMAPEEPRFRRELGLALYSLGLRHGALKQRAEEADALEQARAPFEWLLSRDGDNVDAHHQLAGVLHGLACNRYFAGNSSDALPLIDQALGHSRFALDRSPELPAYRTRLDVHHLLLAELHWKAGAVTASLEAIRRRQALWPGDGGQWYHSCREIARLFAVEGLSGAEQRRLWEELERAARAAADAGFRDWERVQRESEWQTIRASKRLQELLDAVR